MARGRLGLRVTGEPRGPALFRERTQAHRGVGRLWPSPPPGQPHEWDVGPGKEQESPPPHQVAVFLCGLPSTGWAPCGLNTGPGLQTQPRRWAGQGSAGLGRVLLPGAAGQAARGSVSGSDLGAGRKGPSELDPSEQSLLHAPPPVLKTLSPNPAPAYLLDPFFSSSHVASPLPLEVGPASNPVPQTGSPLGIW